VSQSDHNWVVISRPKCPYCVLVKELLTSKGIEFTEFDISKEFVMRDFLVQSGLTTVPQVYRNGQRVGGYDDTKAYLE
jgi:glutaredoxin 3